MYTKEQQKEYRLKNLAKYREYQKRYRASHKEGIRAYDEKWKKENVDRVRSYKRKYVKKRILSENQLFKRKARESVKYALRKGKLVKNPCEICGIRKVDAHHKDYTRPLDVKWVCRLHHLKLHSATLVSLG